MQIEIEEFRRKDVAIELVTDKVYAVPGWEPVPLMRFFDRLGTSQNQIIIAASIGCLQWTLKSREELDEFINRAVPVFCFPTSPINQLEKCY